jgi:predicted deacetylase
VCASLEGIHDVVRGTTERGRALSIGEGFVADAWWCRALVAAAGRTAAAGGLVRLNVAATQLSRRAPRSALLDAVDRVTGEHSARVSRYEWSPVALVGVA